MQLASIDAPIEGWDAFHSIDNAPPASAIILDNLIPGAGSVVTRLGSLEYADLGTGVPVETVADYHTRNDSKLIAASGGGMWDITGGNEPGVQAQAITEIAAPGTYANDRWQTANFRKLDEEGVLIMCNGADATQIFDGTIATDAVYTVDEAPFTDPFIGVVVFKGRTYYWADDDNAFYYAAAGAYQGELFKFDLGSIVTLGGKITLITSWTQQDSGDGKDDFFVVVFDTGETLVYQGDDPDTQWEIVGKYYMAEPLSIRGATNYGSDTIVMTKDGYVALSTIVQQGRTSDVPAFSRLIHRAIKEQTQLRGNLYGWECHLFQKQGLFVFNVPLSGTTFNQHVMNTVTQKWSRFTELNVNTMEVHDERLFGGTSDGRVLALLETTADEGNPIVFTAIPAFQYLGDTGRQKHVVAVQPMTTNSTFDLFEIQGLADFKLPDLIPPAIPPTAEFGVWSIEPAVPPQALGSFWDEAEWATDDTPLTYKGWFNLSAYGYSVTYLLRFAKVNEQVIWRSTGLRYFTTEAQ